MTQKMINYGQFTQATKTVRFGNLGFEFLAGSNTRQMVKASQIKVNVLISYFKFSNGGTEVEQSHIIY
jgi:hypothetical protein